MEQELSSQEQERLKAENDYLKMKLMLERGAKFGGGDDESLTPDIENLFLKNIIELEKKFDERKPIKIYDKIERPVHFRPVTEIGDHEIDKAWEDLSDYLATYQITLDVCSPNIGNRELYRFVTEELFDYETDDIDMPGLMHTFIYDEFHPDASYDNARAAEDCLRYIFSDQQYQHLFYFRDENIRINNADNLSATQALELINQFKKKYIDFELQPADITEVFVDATRSYVYGRYSCTAKAGKETILFAGTWKIYFTACEGTQYWDIYAADIEGLLL